jgi:hypothetical protein
MEVIDKPRGTARVLLNNELLLKDVPYQLTVWREAGHTDVRVDGRLDVSFDSAIKLMESPLMLTLALEDGRSFEFRLTTTTGRITNEQTR